MKELIERIIKAVVDNPDEVTITQTEGHQLTVYEVKVAKQWGQVSS